MVARLHGMQKVRGSNPLTSTEEGPVERPALRRSPALCRVPRWSAASRGEEVELPHRPEGRCGKAAWFQPAGSRADKGSCAKRTLSRRLRA